MEKICPHESRPTFQSYSFMYIIFQFYKWLGLEIKKKET